MKESIQEKELVQVNRNSIFYKIKRFFKSIFHKNETIKKTVIIKEKDNSMIKSENKKDFFIESIKNIEDEETQLLKLQKQYRNGEIREEELTDEQVNSLCDLYDRQIANLKKSNEIRKQKLLEYRKKLQLDN